MSDRSHIEWTDATWNVVIGCDKVSPGCDHCYAIRTAHRMQSNPNPKVALPYAGTEAGGEWTGRVNLVEDRLSLPLRWRRPRKIFVNAQSDLFHDSVPDDYIARVFAVMALAPRHTFQVLTKRHARMRSLLNSRDFYAAVYDQLLTPWAQDLRIHEDRLLNAMDWCGHLDRPGLPRPLCNVWLGVSAENQQWATIRGNALRETPAAVRFYSFEPLLGPVADANLARIDWVITGGESGRGARPMHPDWARSLRDQCQDAGVAFLFKQWGEWAPNLDLNMPVANGRRLKYERRALLPDGSTGPPFTPCTFVDRVGKKAAGRELDGRTWDEFPAVTA